MTATAQKPMRLLVDGGDPDVLFSVPLLVKAEDYREAPDIRRIAEDLMDAHPERFGDLRTVDISYLWKRKGGMSNGAHVRGKAVKPSPLVKHFGHQVEAVIWVAADNCLGMTAWQMEALVYHEMSHLLWDDEKEKLTWQPHDFEGFGREFELYGSWNEGLRIAHRAGVQLPLPEVDEDDDNGDD